MKTVYEYFLTYADSQLAGKDDATKKNVVMGIKAFLTEMDMVEEADPEGNISRRELLRFKMMPADTFVAFFEYYEVRSKVLQFRRECELLAVNRLKNDTLITTEAQTRKLTEFYDLVAALALDSRYASWIDDIASLIKTDLSFATGKSSAISSNLVEWISRNSRA